VLRIATSLFRQLAPFALQSVALPIELGPLGLDLPLQLIEPRQ
jgi:hypothetical protein